MQAKRIIILSCYFVCLINYLLYDLKYLNCAINVPKWKEIRCSTSLRILLNTTLFS